MTRGRRPGRLHSGFIGSLEPRRLCAAGDADLSFAPRGSKDIGVAGEYSQFVRLPNGGHQITLQRQFSQYGGYTDEYDGTYVPITTRDLTYDTFRLKANGSIDRSYGDRGYVDSPLDNVITARTTRNGSVFLFGYAGNRYDTINAGVPAIIKLRPNGTLDRAFGDRGKVVLQKSLLTSGYLRKAVLSPRGELTVLMDDSAGTFLRHFDPADTRHVALGGRIRIELKTSTGVKMVAKDLAVGPDDHVYVGGANGLAAMRVIGRDIDPTFGNNGIATSKGDKASGGAIAVDSRGRVSVVGTFSPGYQLSDGSIYPGQQAAVRRFTADGQVDKSFAGGTVIAPKYAGETFLFDDDLDVDSASDGSLFVRTDQTVFHLRNNGSYDANFGLVLVRGQFLDATDAVGSADGRLLSLYDHKLFAVQTTQSGSPGESLRVDNRTLSITGDAGKDDGYLSCSFTIDDVTASQVTFYDAILNGIGRRLLANEIDRAVINLNAGDDSFNVRSRLSRGVKVNGGDGDDRLDITADKPTVFGGNGNDVLHVGTSSIYSYGNSLLDGGAGDDLLESNVSGHATIFGGSGNDTLIGGQNSDSLYGNAGNDQVNGRSAKDLIDGGSGVDELITDQFNDGATDVLTSVEGRRTVHVD